MPDHDAALDPALAAWAESQHGGHLVSATGLRAGGAPWRLSFSTGDAPAILRVGDDLETVRIERAAMIWAAEHGIPAPRVLSSDPIDEPLLLISEIGGSSVVPREASTARLEAMGAAAASIQAAAPPELPRRLRSVNGVDFVALWDAAAHPLRERARHAIEGFDPDPRDDGFVHGDLWMGNAMWAERDALVAVIDWDCAGRGPAGVDLGSARMDAATAYGDRAEDHVLRGWERQAGRPADDLARWDVVAALCTPPDMGWFTTAIQQQGREDLTRELLVERRDAFLERALAELGV